VVGGKVAKSKMVPFGVVVSTMIADFDFDFGQVREATPIEQFSSAVVPKRFCAGITVAVAALAPTLHDPITG
jgi:hypothetical protein